MTLHRIARPFLLLAAFVLYAQDASLVLRTSVGYRTLRNSAQLSDEQKQQADALTREAEQANAAGKYGDAMRAMQHGMAVMRGVPWTPAYEFAAGLTGKLDHAVVDPGKQVTVSLAPLYQSAGAKLGATVYLVSRSNRNGAGEKPLATAAVDPGTPFSAKVALPAETTGDYAVEVRLAPDGDTPPPAARAGLVKSLPIHIEALSAPAQKLRDRLAKDAGRKSPALPSAQYAVDFYDHADRGEASPIGFNFSAAFAQANEILDAVEASRDPFAGKRGDFHKAYRSAVDNTLQPYRVLVPEAYNASKPSAVVVALHGMGGDENSMFDAYNGVVKREAERLGFMVACPKGRDTASMYRGSAEQDVMDVLAEVRRDYNIDPARVYLMGHSMGGYGTWSVSMSHPDVWAALGPISGGGSAAGMAKIAAIPQYVVHGDKDPTVPVTQSRTMVEAGKKAGATIVYMEIPGGNHTDIAVPQIPPMFDFFAKQKKGTN